jgi:H+/gluconate symporter-like permease
MSVWEFFKLYIEVKIWIALLIGIPLTMIVVSFQYYINKKSEDTKKRYRERKEYERKNNG